MTGRNRFRRFEILLVLAALGCSTAPAAPSMAPSPSSVAIEEIPGASWSFPYSARVELSAPSVVDGSVVIVTVRGVPAGATVTGEFEGIRLPFYLTEDGARQAVLGVPYSMKPGSWAVKVTVKEGEKGAEKTGTIGAWLRVEEGQYASEQLQVSPRHLNPRKKDLIRINKEKAEVGRIYSHITPEKMWKGPFRFPIDSKINSIFGTKRMFNGERQSFHTGLDLKAKVGTKVYAPAGGVVVLSKDLFFTGHTVMIDHGYGVITFCAHLSKRKVKTGDRVKAGQLLGLSGMTGRVSGPHLHWQAIVQKNKINPLDLTKVMP